MFMLRQLQLLLKEVSCCAKMESQISLRKPRNLAVQMADPIRKLVKTIQKAKDRIVKVSFLGDKAIECIKNLRKQRKRMKKVTLKIKVF